MNKRLFHSMPSLMLIIVFTKLVGMLREVFLANYFGTSYISDAYLIAISIPTFLFHFIGHSISTSYIPMYNKVKHEYGFKNSLAYTNSIIKISFMMSTILVLLLLIRPDIVVRIFASGFNRDTVNIAAHFVRISAMSLYFMCFVSVLGGYLNANSSFIIPASISLPRNIIIVTSIVISSSFGIQWLGWGLLFSYVAELLLLLPFALKKGYRYTLGLQLTDQNIKETWYIVLPILVGMCVGQVNKIIDRSLASVVCKGGISALTYASIINNAVQEILVTGIITVLFSKCTEWVVKGEHDKVKEKLSNVIDVLILFLLPATTGVLVLSEQIVKIFLARGEFNAISISMTSGALCCYTLGLVFLATRDTLVKVFYAYKSTRITTIIAISSITLNIILNLLLYRIVGLNGLALATTLSAVFNSISLYIILRKRIGDFGLKRTLITIIKSLIGCIIMGGVVLLIEKLVATFPSVVAFSLCTLTGIITYFICCILLRVDLVITFMKKFFIK